MLYITRFRYLKLQIHDIYLYYSTLKIFHYDLRIDEILCLFLTVLLLLAFEFDDEV